MGLEDLPHAAFAEPLQECIRAEDKLMCLTLKNVVGLVGGDPAALEQLARQRLGLGETSLQELNDFF